jgi:hypothetical protein
MPAIAGVLALVLTGCGGGGPKQPHFKSSTSTATAAGGVSGTTPQAAQQLGFPTIATKNTTRVPGADPVADAAGAAVAVFPSAAAGTHPTAVALAPTSDWQAAIAPTGSGPAGGAQVIRIGAVPDVKHAHTSAINGNDAYTLAAAIDRFVSAVAGRPSSDVMIASATNAAYAMPAAAWAAESGNPILFVGASGIPAATRQALLSHSKPHIYVLGPPNVIPDATMTALGKYGAVKRVSGTDPAANSVAFAIYRDPACKFGQPCAHVPNSFGWALRSPGHGYVLLNASRPLDAAAAAALSGSGDYGPGLVVENASTLSKPVLNYFLDYATPGYTEEGPTAAVYNHAWMIGDSSAISVAVQAEVDRLLEAVPQKGSGQ